MTIINKALTRFDELHHYKYEYGTLLNEVINSKENIIELGDKDYLSTLWGMIYEHTEDVVYYSRAMEFLSQNDSSLKDSMELAEEAGYNLQSLSSELLASLLKTKLVQDELIDKFKEFLEFVKTEYFAESA